MEIIDGKKDTVGAQLSAASPSVYALISTSPVGEEFEESSTAPSRRSQGFGLPGVLSCVCEKPVHVRT